MNKKYFRFLKKSVTLFGGETKQFGENDMRRFDKEKGRWVDADKNIHQTPEKDLRYSDIANIERNKISKLLAKYNIKTESPLQTSETDFGISHYFYVINPRTGEELKVRVSDHPATNPVREATERMLTLTEKDFESLEKVTNPERFDITEKEIPNGKGKIKVKEYKRKTKDINSQSKIFLEGIKLSDKETYATMIEGVKIIFNDKNRTITFRKNGKEKELYLGDYPTYSLDWEKKKIEKGMIDILLEKDALTGESEFENAIYTVLARQNMKQYSVWSLTDLIEEKLKENNIPYKIDSALTGTRYITTNNQKIRISDHQRDFIARTGRADRFDIEKQKDRGIIDFDILTGEYSPEEINNILSSIVIAQNKNAVSSKEPTANNFESKSQSPKTEPRKNVDEIGSESPEGQAQSKKEESQSQHFSIEKSMQKIPKIKLFGEQINMFGDSPQEGQTKQGKGGLLTLRNHRWHLDDKNNKGNNKENDKKEVWEQPAEFSKDPNQLDVFNQRLNNAKDKYYSHNLNLFETTQEEVKKEKDITSLKEEKKEALKRREAIISRAKIHSQIMQGQFLNDLDDISKLPINKEHFAFSTKSKNNLLGEIDFNYFISGKEELAEGVLQGIVVSDSTQNTKILSELKDKGYQILKEDFEVGETEESNFRKIIVQKGEQEGTRATVLVMDKKTADAFIDTQKKPNRLAESKISLECKMFSETVPEYVALKQELFKNVGKGKGVCVITGGLAGAGKSTALDKKIYNNKVKVDPDEIKFILGKMRGTDLEDINKNPMKYHNESSLLSKHLLREAIREGKDVVLDSTMKGYSTMLDTIKIAKSGGYKVDGQFVHISVEEGKKRNRLRGEKGGRALTDDIYEKLYGNYQPHQTFFKIRNGFDTYKMYDNSVKFGKTPPVVIKKDLSGEKVVFEKRLDLIQKHAYLRGAILKSLKGKYELRKSRFTERAKRFFKSISNA